jgi:transcriptional regulator with XRE-family HTH domain
MITKLAEYLFYKGQSITDFAKEAKLARSYMQRIVSGDAYPSLKIREHIEKITGGKVAAEDFQEKKQ